MMDDRQIALQFGWKIFEQLDGFDFIQNPRVLIPYALARQKKILPVEESEEGITVAMANPLNFDAMTHVRLFLQKPIFFIFAPELAIDSAIEKCYHQKEEETKKLLSTHDAEKPQEDLLEGDDLLEQRVENPIIKMVNSLLLEAITQGASDIHFEPTSQGLLIRYRVDGVLIHKHSPAKEFQKQILTRLKVMSKMDIAENRLPQDGRIKMRQGGREIDFRVSTLPTVYGERIVIRILDKGNSVLSLERIGMTDKLLQQFKKLIASPEGIILVTGPTGSGKTTTLYSALQDICDSKTNIITVEDPVEYKLSGVSQVSVNPKIDLTFAKGLRHILRQDPDVIMIGEIRDVETAEIAIAASLTGHLVFSTLHTNDAPSAITRLSDMGIEPYLLSSSILGVLAQRLVRCICPECKISYKPTKEELNELGLQNSPNTVLYKGYGCVSCMGSGYKGRKAIYELMVVNGKIKEKILQCQGSEEIRKIALENSMQSLFDFGVSLALQGETTSSEVLQATCIGQEHGSL